MRRQRKQLIKPIQILFIGMLMSIINIHDISATLFERDGLGTVNAKTMDPMISDFLIAELEGVPISGELLSAISIEQVDDQVIIHQSIILDSVTFKNQSGNMITTVPVEINVDALVDAYNCELESPEWDTRNRINVLSALWYFLVEEQGVPAENAAGILGNIYNEGTFGLKQNSSTTLSSIEEARIMLGKGSCGWGTAQWTFGARQRVLLEYYEMAYASYQDDWNTVCMLAECGMLLEELKGYNVFDDIYTATSIEDATGRVACIYEGYESYWEDWCSSSGLYFLIDDSSNGANRLNMANNIYDYFMR